MTPLDLRIFYKSETGEYPTYGKSGGPQFSGNYKGGLTHEYAQWLEEYQGSDPTFTSMTWKRDYFLKETGLQATYYDKSLNLCYTRAYKEWMENLLCKLLTT